MSVTREFDLQSFRSSTIILSGLRKKSANSSDLTPVYVMGLEVQKMIFRTFQKTFRANLPHWSNGPLTYVDIYTIPEKVAVGLWPLFIVNECRVWQMGCVTRGAELVETLKEHPIIFGHFLTRKELFPRVERRVEIMALI